jgi:hypothetical protein
MAVCAGMLIATILGVCLVPMLFVLVERLTGGNKHASPPTPETTLAGHGGGH